MEIEVSRKSFAVMESDHHGQNIFILTYFNGEQKILSDEYSLMQAIGSILGIRPRKKVKRRRKK
jgi:hypothetical protein